MPTKTSRRPIQEYTISVCVRHTNNKHHTIQSATTLSLDQHKNGKMLSKTNLSIVCFIVIASYAASGDNIFDLLFWDDGVERPSQRTDSKSDSSWKSCVCNGPSCICCVDFNFLYVDLGGPGCVHMKYISQEEGVAVNVSYGENIVRSDKIKETSLKTICMPIFSNLAELCAQFIQVQSTADGFNGCVQLEPKVLGEFQTQIKIGCFSANSQEMKINSTTNTANDATLLQSNNITNPLSESEEGINEEELLAAVSESAQQGLSFFNHLFSLAFGNANSNNTLAEEQPSVQNNSPNNTASSPVEN